MPYLPDLPYFALGYWYPALRAAVPHAKICPWILDTSNATLFHEKVLKNATAFIKDAVAIAKHYGFDGWHIDYEDERPADSYPTKYADLRNFLKQFSDALHIHRQFVWTGLSLPAADEKGIFTYWALLT